MSKNHHDPWITMTDNDVAGVIAVQQKLVKVAGMMGKKGQQFPAGVPQEIRRAFVEVRRVWHRCMKASRTLSRGRRASYRWKSGEANAMRDAAAWIIRKTCELQGRPVPKTSFTPEGTIIET